MHNQKIILYFALPFEGHNHLKLSAMSKICQITGKKVITGNKVSHSNRKTKRTFEPNLQTKRFFVPELQEWVMLKISAAGIRIINKNGVYAALMSAEAKGHLYRS